jgi:hypothetical protein
MLEDKRTRENNSNTRDARNKLFIRAYLQSIEFPDQASAKDTKVYYINLKNKNYGRRLKIYATSAAGSMVVEGAEASTAAVLEGVVNDIGPEVEEATDGEMRDTILAAYCFAFCKNSSISKRGRAWEEPTLSQSTSSPCDWAKVIAPSTPCFTDVRFSARTRSSVVSKTSSSFRRLSPGISFLFFGQNPTNIRVNMW